MGENRWARADQAWLKDRAAVLCVLDALGEGVVVADSEGRFEYVNPALAALVGTPSEELVRHSPLDLVHPDDHPRIEEALREREAGRTTRYECRLIHADGSHVPVRVTGAPRWRDGHLSGSFAVVTDLGPRRRVEETLRRAADGVSSKVGEAFFHSLVEHLALATGADTAIVAEMVEGVAGRVRTIAVWRDGARAPNTDYELAGTPCETVAQGQLCLFPNGVQERYPGDHLVTQLEGDAYFGVPLCDSSGIPRGLLVLMNRTPLADPDLAATMLRIFAARASAELERRRSSEDLLQSRKLEGLGRLAGGVAHDFNNVLTAILLSVEQALRSLPPGHPAGDDLDRIRSAGERAAGLTRQLLAFGRRQAIQERVIDLNELVRETEAILRPVLGEQVEFSTQLDPDPMPVNVDSGQIQQVLLNLAVNARDAMPGGGRLTLATRAVRATGGDGTGDQVLLTVTDTGIGMTPEQCERGFEPFYTTKPGQGHGLGLASCHGIITQCGGRITIHSAPGQGTQFRILLPASQEALPDKSEILPVPPRTGSEVILLVEDDPAVRAPLVQSLRSQGYETLEASNGEEALEVADRHEGPIHLLVTDVVMPRMGGIECEKRLRGRRADLRTLFISGYAQDPLALVGQGAPLLSKPFPPRELASRVRQLLDRPGGSRTGS